ncbi:dihydrofolate reductase family protein [Empedobacter brevis]|uniref:dihydrofolate reductase family protein n=1 Tax=Empedobacter brevis TaxID=247 RepID=UPI0028A62812|nr:dihydrofolate reductase [Empedobacter brevis]
MRVILYANISVNGKVLLSEFSNHQLPEAIFEVNVEDIQNAGNLIMGRKSYDAMGIEVLAEILNDVQMVIMSQTEQTSKYAHIAAQPAEAIDYLAKKGYENILVGGGTEIYNAFLKLNLVTDVVLNILPIITEGGDWFVKDELNLNFKLISHKVIGENVLQLHYKK